jgi:hypothetical protein
MDDVVGAMDKHVIFHPRARPGLNQVLTATRCPVVHLTRGGADSRRQEGLWSLPAGGRTGLGGEVHGRYQVYGDPHGRSRVGWYQSRQALR